jgi:CheY-like chemotaxis protein
VETVRQQAEEAGLELELDVGGEPLWIVGDVARLEQVMVNLLRNAIKFTDPGGHVRLSVSRDGAEAVLEVVDDGIGIAAGDLPGLFELFAQAPVARPWPSDGLGIGLTLVKSLTELHGGRVSAASDGVGRGSRFTLRFPLCGPPVAVEAEGHSPSGSKQRRVLLVDDNSGMAQAMAELLQHGGHEARIARDGRTAVEMAPDFLPELILLDVELPDIDGYEVARRIRAIGACAGTPIAIMSGHSRDLDRERSRSAGFIEHLVKPVRYSTLCELIERVLAGTADATTGAEAPAEG